MIPKFLSHFSVALVVVCLSANFWSMIQTAPEERVIGGAKVPLGGAPYQVSIQFSGVHLCGGSILTPRYILTSAYCATAGPVRMYSVRAGFNKLSKPETGYQDREVEEIIVHERFDEYTLANDIAVLRLSDPLYVNEGNRTASVKLPTSATQKCPPNVNITIAGWGATRYLGYSDVLRGSNLSLIPEANCSSIHGSRFNVNTMLCGGGKNDTKGHCHGDEGGAVMCHMTTPTARFQVGIVSWNSGAGCALQGLPGVYTSTAPYLGWLQNVTKPRPNQTDFDADYFEDEESENY